MITEETRNKMRQAKLGKRGNATGKHWKIKDTSKMHHAAWNKGIPMSEEAKHKMAARKRGKPSILKGKKLSEEHRNKLRNSHIGQKPWNKGRKCSQLGGENHWNWQGGKTSETKRRTNTLLWKHLRKQVYVRDNWSCQICGKKCHNDIQCHHIKPYESFKDDTLENLITLCKSCHLITHHNLKKALGVLSSA